MRANHKRGGVLTVVLVIFLLLAATMAGGFFYYSSNTKAASSENKEIGFVVEKNSTVYSVLSSLNDLGLIKNETVAKVYVKLHKDIRVYAGNFILNANMDLDEIFAVLSDEKQAIIDEVKVSIIDGYWAKDAAKAIAEKTNLTEKEILDKWNDVDYVNELVDKYEVLTEEIFSNEHVLLEGYIFPDTYYFYHVTTVEQVTEKILDHTQMVYDELAAEIKDSKFSTHELFTLASVVLFEANKQSDMELVASVFYNRLNKGMKLQSSVTVCYALYEYDDWTDCETNPDINSKYNTYKFNGLPVGPVCNPNMMALKATLNPKESDYLYFMADVKTGKVYFAKTYEEHLKNVRKYLK